MTCIKAAVKATEKPTDTENRLNVGLATARTRANNLCIFVPNAISPPTGTGGALSHHRVPLFIHYLSLDEDPGSRAIRPSGSSRAISRTSMSDSYVGVPLPMEPKTTRLVRLGP